MSNSANLFSIKRRQAIKLRGYHVFLVVCPSDCDLGDVPRTMDSSTAGAALEGAEVEADPCGDTALV